MTSDTEGDQVLIRIVSRLAAEFFMVNVQVRQGTAYLAPPAVSPEYVLAELLVILLLEPDRRLFRHSSILDLLSYELRKGLFLVSWQELEKSGKRAQEHVGITAVQICSC
jgi:hypothetical protein